MVRPSGRRPGHAQEADAEGNSSPERGGDDGAAAAGEDQPEGAEHLGGEPAAASGARPSGPRRCRRSAEVGAAEGAHPEARDDGDHAVRRTARRPPRSPGRSADSSGFTSRKPPARTLTTPMTMCQAFSHVAQHRGEDVDQPARPPTRHRQQPELRRRSASAPAGHSTSTTTDSAPASPSSARTPPSTELRGERADDLEHPVRRAAGCRGRRASTTSVEPGHSTTASPSEDGEDPKPTSSPQWSAIRDSSGGIPALGPGSCSRGSSRPLGVRQSLTASR